ncbi:hypothetical protein WJX84_007962 [Apatococcus fuscideae]|uniref:Uncharacterized protein n=1 Tax=Apatococcus fuscideae TaxID=2026836 RepID=A0AAW1TD67_9CHLO
MEAEFLEAHGLTEIAKCDLAPPTDIEDELMFDVEDVETHTDDFEEAYLTLQESSHGALSHSGPLAIKWLEVSA